MRLEKAQCRKTVTISPPQAPAPLPPDLSDRILQVRSSGIAAC